MNRETYIRAVLECNFAGFKEEIIETAVQKIMERADEDESIKHGRWKHHQYGNTAGYYECDNCGKINSYESSYCPKCGAKMDAPNNARWIKQPNGEYKCSVCGDTTLAPLYECGTCGAQMMSEVEK